MIKSDEQSLICGSQKALQSVSEIKLFNSALQWVVLLKKSASAFKFLLDETFRIICTYCAMEFYFTNESSSVLLI